MKLNNKGFAISSIMYLILVMALIISAITIALIMNRKIVIDKQKINVLNSLESDLILSKITYFDVPIDNSWSISDNSTINDGVLTIGSDGKKGEAISDYLYVNGNFFYFTYDFYAENAAPNYTDKGAIYWSMNYYNSEKQLTKALDGRTSDGFAKSGLLNIWDNNLTWTLWNTANRYGPDVIYTNIDFKSGYNVYSKPPVQIRNIKLYVENLENDFYLINPKLKSGNKIELIKYEKGKKYLSYFRENGIVSEEESIRVTENGIYTVYVKDTNGKESIANIEVTEIR